MELQHFRRDVTFYRQPEKFKVSMIGLYIVMLYETYKIRKLVNQLGFYRIP